MSLRNELLAEVETIDGYIERWNEVKTHMGPYGASKVKRALKKLATKIKKLR